ncbi:MAG: GNAT family N-acetyltransferase [Pyrinomonadaceae bacterium]
MQSSTSHTSAASPTEPGVVAIVPARADHLPGIAALAAVIWRAYYPGIISVEQIDYMLERMYDVEVLRDDINTRGISIDRLLLRGDALIGFAAYGPAEQSREMKLHKLYLHPDEQRKGYGTLLLQHVESTARERGYHSLILAVNKVNRGAIEAYRRNAFTVRESVIVDIGGGFVMDDFIMVKALTSQ